MTIPAVTLAGDFVIEFDFTSSSLDGFDAFLTDSSTGQITARVGTGTSSAFPLNSVIGDGQQVTGTSSINNGVLNKLKITRVGQVGSVLVNNIIEGSVDSAGVLGDQVVDTLYRRLSSNYASGILANLKIWDNGTLIRDYPLDEPKGTSVIYDTVGGNNGAIVNGDDEDKGLFTQQANGDWLGQELSNKTEARLPVEYTSGVFYYWDVNQSVAGLTYRIACNLIGPISIDRDATGWSAQTGIPATQAFRSKDGSSGFYGGDYTASTSDNQRLFYSDSTGETEFDNISVKEVLKSA